MNLFIALELLGCAGDEAPKGQVNIALITKSNTNATFLLAAAGASAAATDLSASLGRTVEVTPLEPQGTADEQVALVQHAIDAKFSGIAISTIDAIKLAEPINGAVQAGIPVMTFDSDSPTSQRFAYLSVDNVAGGIQAARLLAKAMSGSGKVGILTGNRESLNLNERIRGFDSELTRTQSLLQIVSRLYCDEKPDLCASMVEGAMVDHPDIEGWFFVGGWPLTPVSDAGGATAMPLWERAAKSKRMSTVVFNNTLGPATLLKAGLLTALIGQKFYQWGYQSTTVLVSKIVQGTQYPAFIDTGSDTICPNNVDVMLSIWNEQAWARVVPDCNFLD